MYENLLNVIRDNIIGRSNELELIIATLDANKHILLEGPPGTSKSTILQRISELSNLPLFLLEGNADLTPGKLLGHFDPALVIEKGFKPELFVKGPLFEAMEKGGLLYIDEFNRMASDASNTLIRAIEEHEIIIPRYGIVTAHENFRVVLAQNPFDDVGVGKISRALYDRLIRITLDYQSEEEEREIVFNECNLDRESIEKLVELGGKLTRATRNHSEIKQGASVRGAIDFVLIANKLFNLSQSRDSFEIIRDAAFAALSGKVWIDPASEKTVEQIIEALLLNILSSTNLALEIDMSMLELRKKKHKKSEIH